MTAHIPQRRSTSAHNPCHQLPTSRPLPRPSNSLRRIHLNPSRAHRHSADKYHMGLAVSERSSRLHLRSSGSVALARRRGVALLDEPVMMGIDHKSDSSADVADEALSSAGTRHLFSSVSAFRRNIPPRHCIRKPHRPKSRAFCRSTIIGRRMQTADDATQWLFSKVWMSCI